MIELFGELYYIDFSELDKFLLLNKNDDKLKNQTVVKTVNGENTMISKVITTTKSIQPKEIDGVKFEIIRGFIHDLGEENYEEDPKLGQNSLEKTSIRFKLAFNTLLAYGLLKKID